MLFRQHGSSQSRQFLDRDDLAREEAKAQWHGGTGRRQHKVRSSGSGDNAGGVGVRGCGGSANGNTSGVWAIMQM